jgi:hypothetical protein
MTLASDVANHSADIHWPDGFDPGRGDLFTHKGIHIENSVT